MKTRTPTGQLIQQLRKPILGKSQSQFAAMIGVSEHTIMSAETRHYGLSRKLTKQIQVATGADLSGDKLQSPFQDTPYTRDDFNRWREQFNPSNKASVLKQFDEMKTWLKIIFLAAAKPGRGVNRDRLPAVYLSFAEWLNEARETFKLEREIEDVLPDETRDLMTTAHSISALLRKPARAKKELAEHDIDFNKIRMALKKHKHDGFLFIQDEYRETWSPGTFPYQVLSRPRKLIPQSKYWIKEFKGSLDALEKYGHSHPELSKYLKDIGEGTIPIPEFKTGGKS